MAVDADYQRRLNQLAELMLQNPTSKVRRLQREALKYYPLASLEAIRHWMSMSVAFQAAEIANRPLLRDLYDQAHVAAGHTARQRVHLQP